MTDIVAGEKQKARSGLEREIHLPMPGVLRALYAEMRRRLGVGTADAAPEVKALRAAQAEDPEFNFHAAIVYASLEELEWMPCRISEA